MSALKPRVFRGTLCHAWHLSACASPAWAHLAPTHSTIAVLPLTGLGIMYAMHAGGQAPAAGDRCGRESQDDQQHAAPAGGLHGAPLL